jgi:hypothetical protein
VAVDASMNTDYRPKQILWLIRGNWLGYNDIEHKFFLLEPVTNSSSSYIRNLYSLSCRIISRFPLLATSIPLAVQARPALAAESGTTLLEFRPARKAY